MVTGRRGTTRGRNGCAMLRGFLLLLEWITGVAGRLTATGDEQSCVKLRRAALVA